MDAGLEYERFEEGRRVNYWELDRTLQREVRRTYDDDACKWGESRLSEFGDLVGHTVADNADYVDEHGLELETYDERGEVQNRVRYPAEQRENERLVYESGIVADVFHAPPGREAPMPLTHNLAMQYLLCYADVGLDCPVAMTAGAALVLERFDDGELEEYFDRLTTREYDDLVEGAMFLTEKQGGSDVGATETRATYDEDEGCWRLEGEKWFCSNVDAEGTLALARTEGAPDGTAGLSLFLVPHTTAEGELNDQLYRRLKDKLGTISVPTGEVEFRGAEAFLVGDEQAGFKQMAEMLNFERLSNAAGSCGLVGRALLESKIHAANRETFGKTLDEHPLMRADLVDMAVDHEAATAFTFETARLFAERETRRRNGEDADDVYRLLRTLVPIAKARTGRMAVDAASYAMEIKGGDGYVNDFVTNRLLRDAQVLPIWEGPENVLSLDVLRALEREESHEPLLETIERRLEGVTHSVLEETAATVESAYRDLAGALATLASEDAAYAQLSAKRLARYIFDVFAATLLLEEAQTALEAGDGRMALVARRFVDRELRAQEARGIPSGDRFPLEHFDAVVRYAPVDPETLETTATAD
ncbi:acyl-CoA dehydrogenase family protein [Natribaculum luteum]|uniref:Acyl-CoA dehydrogenase family protein n=1 Tax=Natribaculum luteum TaxID=1586232 RepID=A0ABD5NY72_9EURY|nr:acyl-CoA dehydrogenase family protein [Natribaculum luteum]